MADFSELNITAALQIDKDAPFDKALRPNGFKEFIGQKTVANQLRLLLDSAKKRQVTPDHLLFSGPPGLGKTSLAMLVAKELNVNLKITSGPSITRSGDLASILSALEENDILFIDEIHRLPAAAAEMLYIAMEDFRVDVVVGKGVGANSIALPISPFTCIGATTRSGLLPAPLRDRFGFIAQMNYYSPEELAEIVKQSAKKLKFEIDNESALEIGKRSRQTARIANRLLARVRDFAEVNNNGQFNLRITKQALELFEIDESGLDSVDRKVLKVLVENNAKAVGLKAIAAQVSEEVDTIEGAVEPYLLRAGFIKRTATGRIATEKSYKLFDKPYFGELFE